MFDKPTIFKIHPFFSYILEMNPYFLIIDYGAIIKYMKVIR